MGQNLPLQSKVSKYAMSSEDNAKSKISKFCLILDLVTDFGMVITPRCTWYLKTTCAVVLPYFAASSFILGSSNKRGSPGLAQGLSGEPSGL